MPPAPCLTSAAHPAAPQVHDAILTDLVYPTEIVGKRIRYRVDSSKILKVGAERCCRGRVVHVPLCLRATDASSAAQGAGILAGMNCVLRLNCRAG